MVSLLALEPALGRGAETARAVVHPAFPSFGVLVVAAARGTLHLIILAAAVGLLALLAGAFLRPLFFVFVQDVLQGLLGLLGRLAALAGADLLPLPVLVGAVLRVGGPGREPKRAQEQDSRHRRANLRSRLVFHD